MKGFSPIQPPKLNSEVTDNPPPPVGLISHLYSLTALLDEFILIFSAFSCDFFFLRQAVEFKGDLNTKQNRRV